VGAKLICVHRQAAQQTDKWTNMMKLMGALCKVCENTQKHALLLLQVLYSPKYSIGNYTVLIDYFYTCNIL